MVKNIGDVNEHGDMSMELDDLEIGTMSQADKIKAIAGDLGVEASGKGKLEKSATPESDQPDIEDPREEEDDGSTAQSGKDINKQYDYFCPTHQQFVKGNICPGNGEEHQIDDRFMVQREKDGDKKAAKQMDVEASIIRMHNHPAVRDLEKGLGDPSNMRGRMDIIKGEVGFGKATMQKSLDRGTGKADLSKEIAVKIDNLCKSVKEHVNSVKEQIGETQADRIMANIETLQKSMTAAINKGAFKLAMSGIGIVRELENSLPAPTKGDELNKALGGGMRPERPGHKYHRREWINNAWVYFYKDASGKEHGKTSLEITQSGMSMPKHKEISEQKAEPKSMTRESSRENFEEEKAKLWDKMENKLQIENPKAEHVKEYKQKVDELKEKYLGRASTLNSKLKMLQKYASSEQPSHVRGLARRAVDRFGDILTGGVTGMESRSPQDRVVKAGEYADQIIKKISKM